MSSVPPFKVEIFARCQQYKNQVIFDILRRLNLSRLFSKQLKTSSVVLVYLMNIESKQSVLNILQFLVGTISQNIKDGRGYLTVRQLHNSEELYQSYPIYCHVVCRKYVFQHRKQTCNYTNVIIPTGLSLYVTVLWLQYVSCSPTDMGCWPILIQMCQSQCLSQYTYKN